MEVVTRGLTLETMDRPWHTLGVAETEHLLESSPDGLSPEEASHRMMHFGPNEIEREKETPWWTTLLNQFTDPLIYILLIAAVLTAALQDFTDTGVIMAVVFINAIIGFTQERRAQKAMRALADLSAPRCEVIRSAEPKERAELDKWRNRRRTTPLG